MSLTKPRITEPQSIKPRIGVLLHQPLRDRLFSLQARARLEELGDVLWAESSEPISIPDACSLLRECSVAVSSWRTPYPTPEIMERCPELRLWAHAAGSVKHFFGAHLTDRELTVTSCAPTIAAAVAEMVVGEIIIGLRRVLLNAAANRARSRTPAPAFGKVLSSSTIGVIGASQVGRRVIANLQTFAPEILLYDPFVTENDARQLNVRKSDNLLELCAASDAVTLHTPHLPETTALLKAAHFQAMPDDAVFINRSRGECIDEAALIAELQKGRLQAFLDVSAPEPAAPDSPLRSLPNVVYTSHIAGEAETGIGDQVVSDIAAWLRGEPPQMVVTSAMLERIA
jgi:phosphoglycerate dehydrogenase-like enzyme